MPEASDASTPKPPFVNGKAPVTASEDVKFTAPYATPFEPSERSACPLVEVPLIVSSSELLISTKVPSTLALNVLPDLDKPLPAVN